MFEQWTGNAIGLNWKLFKTIPEQLHKTTRKIILKMHKAKEDNSLSKIIWLHYNPCYWMMQSSNTHSICIQAEHTCKNMIFSLPFFSSLFYIFDQDIIVLFWLTIKCSQPHFCCCTINTWIRVETQIGPQTNKQILPGWPDQIKSASWKVRWKLLAERASQGSWNNADDDCWIFWNVADDCWILWNVADDGWKLWYVADDDSCILWRCLVADDDVDGWILWWLCVVADDGTCALISRVEEAAVFGLQNPSFRSSSSGRIEGSWNCTPPVAVSCSAAASCCEMYWSRLSAVTGCEEETTACRCEVEEIRIMLPVLTVDLLSCIKVGAIGSRGSSTLNRPVLIRAREIFSGAENWTGWSGAADGEELHEEGITKLVRALAPLRLRAAAS